MLGYPAFEHKNLLVVFAHQGQKFSIRNQNIIVKDSDGKVILQNSCHKTLSLWIIGHYNLTSALLSRSKKHGFSIFLLSPTMRITGVWSSKTEGNFLLREKQYKDEAFLLKAQWITRNKIYNQQSLLKAERVKSDDIKKAIMNIQSYLDNIKETQSIQELLGLEGSASRAYFASFFRAHQWQGRRPRVKHDITNLLMDMGYTYLFNYIENLLYLYGFDVYKGFLHQNFYQRKSLVCDLVEPFRVIIDHQIRKSYHLKQIQTDDFSYGSNRYYLSYKQGKPYTQMLLNAILHYKADIFYFIQQYYRCFMQNKDISDYPIFDVKKAIKK